MREYFGFFRRHTFERTEVFEVTASDGDDQRRIGADGIGERFDFPVVVCSASAVVPLGAAGFDIMLKAAGTRDIRPYGTGEGSVMEAFYRGGNINGSSFELLNHRTGEHVTVNWALSGAHQAHNAAGAAAGFRACRRAPERVFPDRRILAAS